MGQHGHLRVVDRSILASNKSALITLSKCIKQLDIFTKGKFEQKLPWCLILDGTNLFLNLLTGMMLHDRVQ